ncbi:hypothetical protein HK104_006620 [Borealophlyctis nickersoniae]|nr:hypothetical protein HK104_006620 [Borealophlyctis nickersoniae]
MPIPLPAGIKFYFPKLRFKLVRSNLPPHQAVFHCAPQLNKLDIKNYLEALYSITINDVRTMIYRAQTQRRGQHTEILGSYKKAIVTMEEDFRFPPPPKIRPVGSTDPKETGATQLPTETPFFGKSTGDSVRHLWEGDKPAFGKEPEWGVKIVGRREKKLAAAAKKLAEANQSNVPTEG